MPCDRRLHALRYDDAILADFSPAEPVLTLMMLAKPPRATKSATAIRNVPPPVHHGLIFFGQGLID